MATDDRFQLLEETRRIVEGNYKTSKSKIQTVPSYMQEGDKYEKYYSPKLISLGPIHHGDPKLKRGDQYKLMWASMYAEESQLSPQLLHQRIANNIAELRGLFSWDEIKLPHNHYSDEELAWMLFVDGCAVLQILEKADISKPEDLRVKLDTLSLVERDLFLLENQLPFQLLNLLSKDEALLKITMHGFCELQNMFTALHSRDSPLFRDQEHCIRTIMKSPPPTHLLDCLCTSILSIGMERGDESSPPTDIEIGEQSSQPPPISQSGIESYEEQEKKIGEQSLNFQALLDVVQIYATRKKKENYSSDRNIQELKASGIQIETRKNVGLKNISFSSSFFPATLLLPPLILNSTTVSTLLNLAAYEMCPDYINEFHISSYLKLLDSLIDHQDDVKYLRSSGILHNSFGPDEDVVKLFNTISSCLVHNPILYSIIKDQVESHYKNRPRIWIEDVHYTYFRTPATFINSLGKLVALIALVLTALQTWKKF